MSGLDAVSLLGEALADLFGNQDGAVLASGAAEVNGKITLALEDVVRDKEE